MQETATPTPVSLMKRLAAMFYDGLLLMGLMFAINGIYIASQGNQTIPSNLQTIVTLFIVSLLFFCWFWTHGGSTLGMQAWRIKVVTTDDTSLSWKTACLRYFSALLSFIPLGLGFIWSLFDPNKACWHDKMTDTCVVHVPKAT